MCDFDNMQEITSRIIKDLVQKEDNHIMRLLSKFVSDPIHAAKIGRLTMQTSPYNNSRFYLLDNIPIISVNTEFDPIKLKVTTIIKELK